MADYRNRIDTLISKMFALRPMIHKVDQELLDGYLSWMHRRCMNTVTGVFSRSHVGVSLPSSLVELFDTYNEEVEHSLKNSLKSLRYTIDTIDTLSLILGSEKIETVSRVRSWKT